MPDQKRIAEYFLVVGLPPDDPQELEMCQLEDDEDLRLDDKKLVDPITDITVVNAHEKEMPPRGFTAIEKTPKNYPADLNSESFNAAAMFLCVKRGRDKPPLTEIGVYYHPKDGGPPPDHQIVRKTPYGRLANVSNSSSLEVYLTYKRALPTAAANCPVVTDVCVILANKDESPPHAFIKIDKNLNRGLLSSSVFICYKRSRMRHHQLTYGSTILSRYPQTNHPECPLSDSVPLFCLPTGAMLCAWPASSDLPRPECAPFVLTDAEGCKLYGSALSFYERYPRDQLSSEQKASLELDLEAHRKLDLQVFSNKAIVIISQFPFFDAFKRFLLFLHSRIHSSSSADADSLAVPIEKYVMHFLHEVPCPSPHLPNIELSLSDTTITLRMIEDAMNISQGGASFIYLLSDLGADNAVSLLMYILMEQKLLVHSLRQHRLTRVCEAVISIIFPLQWQCAYIPICPLELSALLHAPVPFIYGFDSRYFDYHRRPPDDVICVDLDASLLHVAPERKCAAQKLLPKKPLKVLKTSLEERLVRIREFEQRRARHAHNPTDMALYRMENDIETSIKECFLRFMACLLRNYRAFLVPIQANSSSVTATDSTRLFDIDGFARSKDRAYHRFYNSVLRTQMFSRFIEENSLGSPGRDESLAFFEECTQLVDDARDQPPLLERDRAVASEHTKLVMPPEPCDPPRDFLYDGIFPPLEDSLLRLCEPGESCLVNESAGDTDAGSTASAALRDGSSGTAEDSCSAPEAPGTPRVSISAQAGPAGDTGLSLSSLTAGQKQAWLRIKHEQSVTFKMGKAALASRARDKVWPYHLLSAAYCLWFPLLPSYLQFLQQRRGACLDSPGAFAGSANDPQWVLRFALELVNRMLHSRVVPVDQVCYRVLLHMAAVQRLPQLAMDVLAGMKYAQVPPNAVTYALYNLILLELGVVSNSSGKPEDATSMTEERSEYRRSMKRSKSDDGQLDGRSPGPSRRALSPDTSSEDRGYGTLVDMDSKVSEIKDFVRVQSDKAIGHQSNGLDPKASCPNPAPAHSSHSSACPDPSPGQSPAPAHLNDPSPGQSPAPSHSSHSSACPDPSTGLSPAPSRSDPAPPRPCPAPALSLTRDLSDSALPASPDSVPPCSRETSTETATEQPPDPASDVDAGKEEEREKRSQPIVRRPKRPILMRNRSLTCEDRRPNENISHRRNTVYHLHSNDAGLLNSMTPKPDDAFDPLLLGRASLGPLAESTPLEEKEGQPARPSQSAEAGAEAGESEKAEAEADEDATPKPDCNPPPRQPGTPTPPAAPGRSASASASPYKVPVRNLQSLLREKSELHPYFKAKAAQSNRRSADPAVSGSTFSVDSRLSTETEEDGDLDEATLTDDEEDGELSGLALFFKMSREAGLTKGSSLTPSRPSARPAFSFLQSGSAAEDTSSMTSRGSADNALSMVSNIKRQASTQIKDVASRFSQKLASFRQQSKALQPGLNRSTGELRSNSFAGAAASPAPSSWLSTSMRRLRASQDSSLGGAGSMGEDSEDEDDDSLGDVFEVRKLWKYLSDVREGPSPLSSTPSSHRPSVSSPAASPTEERSPGHSSRRSTLAGGPILLLKMTSCSHCSKCQTLIYDEDIMAGWTHEASNLTTRCPFCHGLTLPRLSMSLTLEGCDGNQTVERFSTLYLSPLVLRKVMETVFIAETPSCLQQVEVIEAHPELFWNYLWYLTRLRLPNHLLHLVGLWWSNKQARTEPCRIRVQLKWDSWSVIEDSEDKPLYRLWAEKSKCSEDDPMHPVVHHMDRILQHIKECEMSDVLRLFLQERKVKVTSRSAYREILHLSIQALGRSSINLDSFIYFYSEAYKQALERNEQLESQDRPPLGGNLWCHILFPVLDV